MTSKRQIINPIGNKRYYESNESFFQVNKTLTEKLYIKPLALSRKAAGDDVEDYTKRVRTILLSSSIFVISFTLRLIWDE